MGLESALVDRARMIELAPSGAPRVRGQTPMAEMEGAWFLSLLQLPQGQFAPDSSQGRRRVVKAPTLMFDVTDDESQPVDLHAGDKVEVDSERYGVSVWEVTGDPEPLASLHDILGYQVGVKRVSTRTFTPMGAT